MIIYVVMKFVTFGSLQLGFLGLCYFSTVNLKIQ